MAQFQYGYIIKAPGYKLGETATGLESDAFKSQVAGVGSIEEACDAARQFVESGVTLVELCSGFKADDAKAVFEAIDGAAKVGFISDFLVKE